MWQTSHVLTSFVLLSTKAVRLMIIQNVKMQNADDDFNKSEKTNGPWMLETNALMKTTGKTPLYKHGSPTEGQSGEWLQLSAKSSTQN